MPYLDRCLYFFLFLFLRCVIISVLFKRSNYGEGSTGLDLSHQGEQLLDYHYISPFFYIHVYTNNMNMDSLHIAGF